MNEDYRPFSLILEALRQMRCLRTSPKTQKQGILFFCRRSPPKAPPTFLKYEAVAGSHEYLKRLLSRAAKKKLRDGIKKVRKC